MYIDEHIFLVDERDDYTVQSMQIEYELNSIHGNWILANKILAAFFRTFVDRKNRVTVFNLLVCNILSVRCEEVHCLRFLHNQSFDRKW